MQIHTVGILSPGDMGQAMSDDKPLRVYAAVLNQHGLKTIAALDDRSERTRRLAAEANIQDVGSLKHLVAESDVVLSVLVPAAAILAAEQTAEAIRAVGTHILYADCNAIAPHKAKNIEQIIQSAGGQFVDASIIGPPPLLPKSHPNLCFWKPSRCIRATARLWTGCAGNW